MKKKMICCLAGIMALLLAACGGDGAGTVASKDYIYKIEEVELEEVGDMSTVSGLSIKDGVMYLSCFDWKEEGAVMSLVSRRMDGSGTEKIELSPGNEQNYTRETADGQGNYYAILNEYVVDDSDPNNVIYQDNYFLVKLDKAGSEVFKKPLNENAPEGEGYWVHWMKLLKDGRIALQDSQGLSIYDGNGNFQKAVQVQTENESNDAFQLSNGDIVIQSYSTESNKVVLNKLNVDTGELSEDYTIPGNTGAHSIYTGSGYDLFLTGNDAIYGYNLGDEELTKLMDFVDSDLGVPYLHVVAGVSERELYALSNDQMTGENILLKLTKVDPQYVVDKTLLTLACYGLDWGVRGEVVNFNKSSAEYRIQITDYSQFDTEDDYTAGMTRLNTDLSSGKVPDILLLNSQLPVESYMAMGLFEDLNPYIDGDQELDREDFFPNVLEAYESNGKLYRLIPGFTIRTVVGKTADVGAEPGWTMEDLEALMASKPEGTKSFSGDMERSGMLRYSIQMSGEQFIDWESGKCSFDSEGFISLLEFANQFPETVGEDYYNEDYWMNYEIQWREGEVLLQQMYLDSFSSYNRTKKATFGEDITLIGFPTEDRNGAAILANLELAMSAKSKHKDGVWQFLRVFLTDAYQEQMGYGLPLSIKRMNELAEEAKKRPSFENEDGTIEEYDDTYIVGGVEITITPMTQAEVDEVIEYIGSVNRVYTYNEELVSIIQEEAEAYFAGQKNAKDVADIIQSRVEIYVNENR